MPGGAPRLEKTALRSATTSETCAEATPMAMASTEARFKTYVHYTFDFPYSDPADTSFTQRPISSLTVIRRTRQLSA